MSKFLLSLLVLASGVNVAFATNTKEDTKNQTVAGEDQTEKQKQETQEPVKEEEKK